MNYQILHIEDSKADADIVHRLIQKSGLTFKYFLASNKNEVDEALNIFEPNVILCDHSLPSFNSKMAYELCKQKNPDLPFILVTGTVSEQFAVEMLKTGVDDYLLKANLQRLPVAIEKAFAKRQDEKKVQAFQYNLEQSETHLRTIFENSSTGLILLDRHCNILELNDRSKYFSVIAFGRVLEKNENLLNIASADLRDDLPKKFKRTLDGEKIQYERVYKQQDGSELIFHIKMSPAVNGDGNVTGACISFEDVSERRKAERALSDSEIFNRSILTSIDHQIAVVEADGTIVSVNKAWSEFYEQNGGAPTQRSGIGSNYITVCKNAVESGDMLAARSLEGFMQVVNNKIPFFEIEYPCHSADKKRWFMLRVVHFAGESPKVVMMHIDISEQKSAEEEMKRLNNRLVLATSSAGMGIWDWDIKNDHLLFDEGMYNLYKIDRRHFDLVYNEWHSRVHQDDRERVSEEIQMAIAGTKQYNTEFRIKTDDQSVRYIKASGTTELDDKGNAVRMIGANWDITELKLTENEIRDYKLALDASSLVDISDKNGIIRNVNETFCKSSKYSKHELIGKDYRILNSDYHSKEFFQHLWKTIGEGKIWSNEIRNKAKDGSHFWVHTTIVPFLDSDGIPFQFITVRKDITTRKNAEESMAKAIERYTILADATSDTIWDWDIENSTMLYNDGIKKMFGYNSSEIKNVFDWWQDKIHYQDFQKVTNDLKNAFRKKSEKLQLSYRFRCADGSYKYIFDRAFIIVNNGKPVRMIGAMQDITHQVEENLRIDKVIIDAQEKERQHLGAELHDNINQILTGASLILGMTNSPDINEMERTSLINSAIGHITEAINEARKLSHSLAPAIIEDDSLKDLFESLLHSMNMENRFDITLDFQEVSETRLSDDIQINLYRILQEQTKNIVKYSEAKIVNISFKIINDSVCLRIFDEGKGFDTKAKKTGIGLSNIKKRVELLSGKFMLNSAPGEGCEVIVEIPLTEQ